MASYSLSTTVSDKQIFNHVLRMSSDVNHHGDQDEWAQDTTSSSTSIPLSDDNPTPQDTHHVDHDRSWCCMVSYCGFRIIYLSDHKLDMPASWLCLCLTVVGSDHDKFSGGYRGVAMVSAETPLKERAPLIRDDVKQFANFCYKLTVAIGHTGLFLLGQG